MRFKDYKINDFVSALRAETPEAVRENYRRLSRQIHPDLNPEMGQEPMQLLNEAYETVLRSWDGKSYKAPTQDNRTTDKTYSYDADAELRIQQIITWAMTNPYTERQEVIGAWIWVWGEDKENCPFKAPKGKKNADGKWESTEEDRRPYWLSTDGTETRVKFEWSKGNKAWYLDTRKIVSRNFDRKRRSRAGLDHARARYGSQELEKKQRGQGMTIAR